MKLVSFRAGDRTGCGVVEAGSVLDISRWVEALETTPQQRAHALRTGQPPASSGIPRLLQSGPAALSALRALVAAPDHGLPILPLADVELLAPVPRPGKIVAIGRNYAEHAQETGTAVFDIPRIIAKFPSAVSAPDAPVRLAPHITKPDFEVELGVVIGAPARAVAEEDAGRAIAGYTILQDISAREFQFDVSPAQTTFAKSHDGFLPMGPWLVTCDELGDEPDVELTCSLNGSLMQSDRSTNMIFPVRRLISYISRYCTLEPGDVIATGTPAGSGAFRKPPVYLKPGDTLLSTITGIGTLTTRIVPESGPDA